jgi:phosphoglycolate phosphatase-like HAD superfamily hydrolase
MARLAFMFCDIISIIVIRNCEPGADEVSMPPIPYLHPFTIAGALRLTMEGGVSPPARRFKHIFLDAEGTLYVPKDGRSRWAFWSRPSPAEAVEFFKLDDGVVDALERLRSEAETVCVVSLNSEPVLDAILDHFDIRRFFDDVMVNGDKGKRISQYLERNCLDKSDAVMVGDTPSLDLYPVLRAGIHSLLVDRVYNRWARAERIRGLSELPTWLRMADIAESMVSNRARIATLDEFIPLSHEATERTKSLIAASGV